MGGGAPVGKSSNRLFQVLEEWAQILQRLINHQLRDRQTLQQHSKPILQDHKEKLMVLKRDVARYVELREPLL